MKKLNNNFFNKINSIEESTLEHLTNTITKIVAKTGSWQGSMTDLITKARKGVGRDLPESPSQMRLVVNRVIRRLAKDNILTKFEVLSKPVKEGASRRVVRFTKRVVNTVSK